MNSDVDTVNKYTETSLITKGVFLLNYYTRQALQGGSYMKAFKNFIYHK